MINTYTIAPARLPAALVLALCLALPGCATIGAAVGASTGQAAAPTPAPGTQLGPNSFVRLVPSEPGAAPNAAFAIDPAALRLALATLRSGAGQAVFLADQLDQLAVPLSAALGAAAPGQDVAFAAAAVPPGLRLTSSQTVTSGRLFVADGKLNMAFGLVQSPFDLERLSRLPSKVFTTGSRLGTAGQGEVGGGAWRPARPGRGDWLALPLDSLTALPAASVPALSPAVVSPAAVAPALAHSDTERRLATLARLRQQGMVSEEEFQEKRRAILKDL